MSVAIPPFTECDALALAPTRIQPPHRCAQRSRTPKDRTPIAEDPNQKTQRERRPEGSRRKCEWQNKAAAKGKWGTEPRPSSAALSPVRPRVRVRG